MSCNYIQVKNRTYTHSSSSIQRDSKSFTKPVEIYAFLDPLCERSWSLEPYFKKLHIEYGEFISIRPVISRQLSVLTEKNLNKLKNIWRDSGNGKHFLLPSDAQNESFVLFPWVALAIKAAELQGKNGGRIFLRKIQEQYFLKKENVLSEEILILCAEAANLDISEFKNDLFSSYAKNAYQCDLKVIKDMEVDKSPTLVLFNQITNEQGVKVPGVYPYEAYVQVLKDILGEDLKKRRRIDLEQFIKYFRITTSKEVSIIFDWPITKAVQELKKLQIKQLVEKVSTEDASYWEYMD